MSENVRIDAGMDRLVPIEKFRDPEIKTVRQERSHKKKARKHQPGPEIDADGEKEASEIESDEHPSGKILDITV